MMRDGLRRSHRYAATGILIASLLIGSLNGVAMGQPPAGYVLGPGDLLEISVWGYPDLTRQGTVGPDGEIALPLIGMIRTSGVSVERLTALIAKAYAEFIIDPHVAVTIKEYRKLRVAVLGQIAHPGSYDLPLGTRLLDLVAAGGGPTEAAALGDAQLLRPGLPALRVDLTQAMAGAPEVNAPLAGGETLVVPEDLTGFVTVQGEVARPGRYRLKGEMRVLDALMLAGGLTERASVMQASLARASGKAEPLLLDGLLLRQEMDRNIPLSPGDVLFIPEEVDNKIYVIGDVRNPGVFPVKGHVTLLQAIAMAGGPEQRGPGTAASAFVVRRSDNTPQEVTAGPARVTALPNGHTLITADLGAITRDPSRDIPVQPGDVLVLPMTGMGGFQMIASVLAGVAYIFK